MYLIKNPTKTGRFIKRLNRFVAKVEVDGQVVKAHVPNSGRMKELLFSGNRVVLEEKSGEGRKTSYDLIMAEYDGYLVSIDSRLPNYLVEEAINKGQLPGFGGLKVERREVSYGDSRLDLKLTGEKEGYCEIKSVTLVKDGIAMFPDAPTSRGARHLRELIRAQKEGFQAFIVFLVQRDDAVAFKPNDETDPEFGTALREAMASGVQVKAYTCRVSERGVEVIREIPVEI
ncbi:hypothetical protein BBF96_05920 [Anoxybacter fermentans]|uniref:Sugar fermentation stimulation protein homolog n=1 Tax=Anoxybacter fermentans TaxID=1323375 RepID=A0A3Q9HQ21_9FIRM|nr:DNA/RNA nuclease SfsA [Anoxybacter fermentans]AZR72971.1 hypothetical protein BBF96_05920 [Anoxybacter fermentans]